MSTVSGGWVFSWGFNNLSVFLPIVAFFSFCRQRATRPWGYHTTVTWSSSMFSKFSPIARTHRHGLRPCLKSLLWSMYIGPSPPKRSYFPILYSFFTTLQNIDDGPCVRTRCGVEFAALVNQHPLWQPAHPRVYVELLSLEDPVPNLLIGFLSPRNLPLQHLPVPKLEYFANKIKKI